MITELVNSKENSNKRTVVVNKKKDNYDVYIGRGSKYGNPYIIGEDGSRDIVIRKYKEYFYENLASCEFTDKELYKLKNKRLGCFCKPENCHGDIIADYVDSIDTYKVIVAGSRNYFDYAFVKKKLDFLFSKTNKPIEIVDGRAKGADSLGRRYSQEVLGYDSTGFEAEWDNIEGKPANEVKVNKYGKPYWSKAGMTRNSKMSEYADAAVVFIKNNSRGSLDMAKKAKEKGLQVRIYHV